MTPREHLLMILWFTKQNQSIRILLDMLRSRDVITADDEKAFEFSQMHNVGSNSALFHEVKDNYLKLAKEMGIQTGLENMPELPNEWFRPPSS